MTELRQGLVALGDSITRGRGGAPALGVHPQSWALWLAEALELPYTNLAIDGETAPGVVARQLPRLKGPYDVATLYIGANDARGLHFDPSDFEAALATVLGAVTPRAERTLVLTLPLDLGRPPAGAKVPVANAIIRDLAARHGAIVCPLDDFAGARFVLPDAVHPTSAGMVEIADRAVRALGEAGRPWELAEPRSDAPAKARYRAWYAKQQVRDHRRRLVERWRYRHEL
jgi:lysophospholipase L1-like esterase